MDSVGSCAQCEEGQIEVVLSHAKQQQTDDDDKQPKRQACHIISHSPYLQYGVSVLRTLPT